MGEIEPRTPQACRSRVSRDRGRDWGRESKRGRPPDVCEVIGRDRYTPVTIRFWCSRCRCIPIRIERVNPTTECVSIDRVSETIRNRFLSGASFRPAHLPPHLPTLNVHAPTTVCSSRLDCADTPDAIANTMWVVTVLPVITGRFQVPRPACVLKFKCT